MLSLKEAQELHRIIGGYIESANVGYQGTYPVQSVMVDLDDLGRARELAALIVSEAMEAERDSSVSYDPCITGTVEIHGVKSEFLLPLDRDSSTKYSQWGASNTVLWPRTELVEALADAAREFYLDNPIDRDDEDDEIGGDDE